MGVYFYYCNLDKREYIDVGISGSRKFSGIGHGLAARALGLFLTESVNGRWTGDRIAVIGDEFSNFSLLVGRDHSELAQLSNTELLCRYYHDITADSICAVINDDADWVEELVVNDTFLMGDIARLANTGKKECLRFLESRWGTDWRKTIKDRIEYR